MKHVLTFLFFFAAFSITVLSQPGSSAVPFLMIPTSVEANGMGGISTVANASSPSSMLFNPAQLGMHSQSSFFSTELNTSKTQWLPPFNLSDLYITNSSFVLGTKLPLSERSTMSVGIGYSRLYLNLGSFIYFPDASSSSVQTFDGHEASDNFSAGVGVDHGYKIAAGMTLKRITSALSPIGSAQEGGSGTIQLWAMDFGLVGTLPIVPFMERLDDVAENSAAPFVSITGAYALNNFGGEVTYMGSQSDPLPRTARLGLSVNAGMAYRANNVLFELLSITIAREAENTLYDRFNDGTWKYTGSFIGNINFTKDVLQGEAHGYVSVRRGFAINLFETVTIREGSFEGDGALVYNTSGYSISTFGVSKFLTTMIPERTGFDPIEFFAAHLEIRYNHSSYSDHPVLGGTEFDTIVFSFHH
jgi:hypothetical protein